MSSKALYSKGLFATNRTTQQQPDTKASPAEPLWIESGFQALADWFNRDGWGVMLLSPRQQLMYWCAKSRQHVGQLDTVLVHQIHQGVPNDIIQVIQHTSNEQLKMGWQTQLGNLDLRISQLSSTGFQLPHQASACLVLSKPRQPSLHDIAQTRLSRRYQLTPKEILVAFTVAEGLNIEKVADKLCISHHTVRTHLRSVFSKTEITSQSQLVSLILREYQQAPNVPAGV